MSDGLIQPHGSETLNPLYVADDAKRAALTKEAEPFVPKWTQYKGVEPEYGQITLVGSHDRQGPLNWPRRVYPVQVTTRSTSKLIPKVRHEITSHIDAEGTFSWRFDKYAREGRRVKEEYIELDHRKAKAYYYKKRREEDEEHLRRIVQPIEALVQDPLSVLYFLRCTPLSVGQTLNVRVHTSKENWDTHVHIVGQETLKTPAGNFDCLIVKPVFRYEGLFHRESDPTVWLEKSTHIPIQMEVDMMLGHVRTTLKAAEGVPAWGR